MYCVFKVGVRCIRRNIHLLRPHLCPSSRRRNDGIRSFAPPPRQFLRKKLLQNGNRGHPQDAVATHHRDYPRHTDELG